MNGFIFGIGILALVIFCIINILIWVIGCAVVYRAFQDCEGKIW